MADYETLKVFSGNSNQDLSEKIAKKIGIPIGKALVGRFSDGEIQVEHHEDERVKDEIVIQSTCKHTNENVALPHITSENTNLFLCYVFDAELCLMRHLHV